jgi:2-amino-4-hydroxy-6-hydroxymethyldihydropteridine diphosphokinase
MNKVTLLAGGNLGERKDNLEAAIKFICKEIGGILKLSSIYETEPWGFEHEQNFLNQAVEVETEFAPEKILEKIHEFENNLGKKKRTGEYLARTIDIDILFFNDEIINQPDLIIPHPRLHERKFVLEPLAEIIPDFIHPVFNEKISKLNNKCLDDKWVRKLK